MKTEAGQWFGFDLQAAQLVQQAIQAVGRTGRFESGFQIQFIVEERLAVDPVVGQFDLLPRKRRGAN